MLPYFRPNHFEANCLLQGDDSVASSGKSSAGGKAWDRTADRDGTGVLRCAQDDPSKNKNKNNSKDKSNNNSKDKSNNNSKDKSNNNSKDKSNNNSKDKSNNNSKDKSNNNSKGNYYCKRYTLARVRPGRRWRTLRAWIADRPMHGRLPRQGCVRAE